MTANSFCGVNFSVQTWLLDSDCPFGFSVVALWKPRDMTILCEALTRHGRHEYDLVLNTVSNHIVEQIDNYKSKELVACMRGFHKANLAFPQTATIVSERIGKEVRLAATLRKELSELSVPRLCFFLHSLSHFGYNDPVVISTIRWTCDYLSDRIDSVPERSAIRVCWAMAVYNLFCKNSFT